MPFFDVHGFMRETGCSFSSACLTADKWVNYEGSLRQFSCGEWFSPDEAGHQSEAHISDFLFSEPPQGILTILIEKETEDD